MPVELRKRKAHQQPTETAPPAKKKSTVAKAADKVKKAIKGDKKSAATKAESKKAEPKTVAAPAAPAAPKKADTVKLGKIAPGDVIDLDGFGGEIETNDGEKTTLKKLVDESGSGVVLFTYPKASTPGCEYSLPSSDLPADAFKARLKYASSATRMSLSPRMASPSTVSVPTVPRPTLRSRQSKSCLTRCCATRRGL